MTIRAKMRVDTKSQNQYGFGVKLQAVYGDNPENKAFFQSTPSGTVDLNVVKPEVADAFVLGAEYYVDFIPVNGRKE